MQTLVVLLLAAHLLAMNVSSGGPLICVWLQWKQSRGDADAARAGHYLLGASIAVMMVGTVLGLGLAVLLWDDAYRQAVSRLGSKVLFGTLEWLFSWTLMVIAWWWWRRDDRRQMASRRGERIRMLLNLLAATNLLYHFPLLFVVMSRLAHQPTASAEHISSSAFRQWILRPDVASRALHFVLAAIAVSSLMLVWRGLRLRRDAARQQESDKLVRWGARIALAATLPQFLVGIWILMALPPAAQQHVTGGQGWTTLALVVSILASLVLMHQLAHLAVQPSTTAQRQRTLATMVLVVVLMTAVETSITHQVDPVPPFVPATQDRDP